MWSCLVVDFIHNDDYTVYPDHDVIIISSYADNVDTNISMSDIHSTLTDFESATTTPVMVRVSTNHSAEFIRCYVVDFLDREASLQRKSHLNL